MGLLNKRLLFKWGIGPVVILVMGAAYAFWSHCRLDFLQGYEVARTVEHGQAYAFSSHFDELNELFGQKWRGFKLIADRRWPDERRIHYASRTGSPEVFLVQQTGQAGLVWVHKPRPLSCRRCCTAKVACIANLKQLDGAKACWGLENSKSTNDTPRDANLFGPDAYIRTKPTCPVRGDYTLGGLDERPRCSIPWHKLPD